MNFEQAVTAYQADPGRENLEQQVSLLVQEMTLEEKIHMLSGHCLMQTMRDMVKTGRNYNVHPLSASGCKRLGIPPVLFTDGPRGVVMGNSTCFPVSMLRASTFDPELEYRFGKAIADEAIAQGANYYAGVCINLVRNPRWGRSQETYGEDPFLLGEFGKALTVSVQEEGMIACPKHFALNSIEDLRFFVDVKCDERTLHEVYLPHFKKCVDAGAQSIMAAYNRYDEFYCSESKPLLTDILRDQWGFDGFVMSDFVFAVHNEEQALRAGLDMEMPVGLHMTKGNVKKHIKKGSLNEEHVDKAVANIIRVLIRQIPKIRPRSMDTVGSQEHRALAREIAEKGMVLLENNGVLPLATDTAVQVCGSYANEANTGDHGSSRVWDTQIVTPFEGIQKVFPNASLTEGDVAVVCVGSNRKEEGEYFAKTNYDLTEKPVDSGGDRASLRLSEKDIELIKTLHNQGKKVVAVLYSGSAVLIDEWKEYADAVIMHYYGGCEGGNALANLLSGKVNFSGKLPFTVARTEEDYPGIIGIGQKPYTIEYGYYHGYTKLDKEGKTAAYPFGYGLSYTEFRLGECRVTLEGDTLRVKTTVENVGKVVGAEVVQVYVGSKGARNGDDRPVKLLKGIGRVEVAPGETANVEIQIPMEELKFYDHGRWVLDDAYTVYVGTNSANAAPCGTITA